MILATEPVHLVWTEWAMVTIFIGGVLYAGWAFRKLAGVSLDSSYLADRKVPGFLASLSTVASRYSSDPPGRLAALRNSSQSTRRAQRPA